MAEIDNQACCGLFVDKTDKPIPLTHVAYDLEINGFASKITIHQTYKNVETTDLECVYGFPMNDQAAITGFTVKIGDRSLESTFKKKEEAFKEYNDAVKEGHGAYLLDQADRSDDSFVLSVGRLPPCQECVISIHYVAALDAVSETKQRLVIPTALSPRYNPSPEQEEGTVAPPEKYQSSVTYAATLKGRIQTIDAVKSVSSPSHPLSVSIESPKEVTVTFGAEKQPLDRDLIIEIEVKNNPEHHVLVEKLTGSEFCAMYMFVPKFDTNNEDVKSELIFLVDCSGSMEDNEQYKDARRAMQIFLQSIPEGCYFNFYRFGNEYTSLFPQSELYGEETFGKAKEYARTTDASMGGTEILPALQHIFSSPVKPGFSRQVFVLTDGEVSNTEEVISLVRKNVNTSRVFSFGIGNYPSRSLVNGIAAAGNGKAEYVKKGEALEDKVGRQLSRALQPSITNASILWEGVKNVRQVPSTLPPVFRGDRQIAYAIFESGGHQNSSVCVAVKGVNIKTMFDTKAASSGESFVAKLAARSMIKELETTDLASEVQETGGSLQNRPVPEDPVKAGLKGNKDKITDISLTYGVMSNFVSLVAVEKREKHAENGQPATMELREIPVERNDPFDYSNIQANSQFAIRNLAMVYAMVPRSMKCSARSADEIDSESSPADELEMGVVSSEVSFEKPPNEPEKAPESALIQVLNLGQWNGSWKMSQELLGILGVSEEAAKTAVQVQLDGDVLATLLVVAFMRKKHQDQSGAWGTISEKALRYTRKTVKKEDEEATIKKLEALF